MKPETHSPKKALQQIRTYASMLLISAPQLNDPNFAKTAVLVAEHGPDGAFGLVLNRPLETSFKELEDVAEVKWSSKLAAPVLYNGGPVMTESIWLLMDTEPQAGAVKEVFPGLYLTADAAAIRSLITSPGGKFRIFMGYSGWGPQQLEAEIASGYWLLAPGTLDLVFEPRAETIWQKAFAEIGVDLNRLAPGGGVH